MAELFPESIGTLFIDTTDGYTHIPFDQNFESCIRLAKEMKGRLRQRVGGGLSTVDPMVGHQLIGDWREDAPP